MNIYQEELLDHVKNPRNYGKLDSSTQSEDSNPACGDSVKIYLKFSDNDVLEEVSFEGTGCAVSQGAASILTEEIKGKNVTELKKMTEDDFLSIIGIELSPSRKKCAFVSFKAMKQAIVSYEAILHDGSSE
ncbi:iron-sulfur cluster assembly scaffold protein [Candidatus Dojkabacteria bacterium]|uniref:Iron-sulfur cluster assembly scaffold protein n=1 Tax=Candidatus Dojkabacteria bacterium TaxID=2099670 RepID=A0A955RH78_9BACT|nr:iron-sulfur cluster assembly scaffold protein [Candidatus Dojkabacteria bacterium]